MRGVGKQAPEGPDTWSESRVVGRGDRLAALWFVVATAITVTWLIALEPVACAAVDTLRYPCPAGAGYQQLGAALITVGATICGLAGTLGATPRT